jgi:hypothetical protein
MKKILLILIGIVLGIALSAAFVKTRIMPFYNAVAKETGQKPFTTLVGDLQVISMGKSDYMIKSKSQPEPTILISTPSDQDMFIGVMEKTGNCFSFADRDSDGSWDHSEYSTSNSLYLYGPEIGYPDVVTRDDDPSLIRIEGGYFEDHHVDEKHFIEMNGEMIELEYMEWNHFKIKESEPAGGPYRENAR